MERLTTTSFGARQLTYAQLAAPEIIDNARPEAEADKWALFRELTTARRAFSVSDRDLAVLNALLTFLPGQGLDPDGQLVVFPSNAALASRAHGMAESTLRRHLAALTASGLLMRHDSPNGKRYAVRGEDGGIDRAFGLDLRALLVRAGEIRAAAAETRAAARRLKAVRERASLRLRDLEKHIVFAMETGRDEEGDFVLRLAAFRRRRRRQLSIDDLEAFSAEVSAMHAEVMNTLQDDAPEKMSGNDAVCERHLQNSKAETHESEPCLETQGGGRRSADAEVRPSLAVSLGLVVAACDEIKLYADGKIRTWRDLCAAASFVRGMMGISADAWNDAKRHMGAETAAIAIACILERMESIRSPGGYLRALTEKAKAGAFSPGPMVMAIVNTREKAPAT